MYTDSSLRNPSVTCWVRKQITIVKFLTPSFVYFATTNSITSNVIITLFPISTSSIESIPHNTSHLNDIFGPRCVLSTYLHEGLFTWYGAAAICFSQIMSCVKISASAHIVQLWQRPHITHLIVVHKSKSHRTVWTGPNSLYDWRIASVWIGLNTLCDWRIAPVNVTFLLEICFVCEGFFTQSKISFFDLYRHAAT